VDLLVLFSSLVEIRPWTGPHEVHTVVEESRPRDHPHVPVSALALEVWLQKSSVLTVVHAQRSIGYLPCNLLTTSGQQVMLEQES